MWPGVNYRGCRVLACGVGFSYRWWWTLAVVAFVHVVGHAAFYLFQQKGSFESEFEDGAFDASFPQPYGIVGFFNLVDSALELDTFPIVCCFDGRRKRRIGRHGRHSTICDITVSIFNLIRKHG